MGHGFGGAHKATIVARIGTPSDPRSPPAEDHL
jgi:hypothetical protein